MRLQIYTCRVFTDSVKSLGRHYLLTGRAVKRLDGVSRSPVLAVVAGKASLRYTSCRPCFTSVFRRESDWVACDTIVRHEGARNEALP